MKGLWKRTCMLILIVVMLIGLVLPMKEVYADELTEEQSLDLIKSIDFISFASTQTNDGVVYWQKDKLPEGINVSVKDNQLYINGTQYKVNAEPELSVNEGMSYHLNSYYASDNGTSIEVRFENKGDKDLANGEVPKMEHYLIELESEAGTKSKFEVKYDDGTDEININAVNDSTHLGEEYVDSRNDNKTTFQKLEEMLSGVVRGTANALIRIINWAVGGEKGVTIDDILFNHYEPTRLAYFSGASSSNTEKTEGTTEATAEKKENGEKPLSSMMVETITTWTNVFTQIAVTGYLAALLYIGIQILFRSTGQKKAEYQRLLIDWVVGIGLLFFFPLVPRYCIEINNALVAQIESAKSANAEKASQISFKDTGIKSLAQDSTAAQQIAFGKSMDATPFSLSDSNYMVKMARKAESSKRLSYAIVYLIMAWQLLMVLITYYRRTFMVGFLLVLFPLVALTYPFDKIKDGRSQAFDRWAKEIMINIFLQTFHAIIYVFALNASFAGGEQNDWLLMIIGVSFLFRGEDIIKNLFGQKSESAASLTSSAVKTAAVFTAVRLGVNKLGDNVTHIGNAVRAGRNARMYDMMADNFNTLASTGPQFNPNAAALPHAPQVMDAEATQLGNDIQTVNHMDVATPEALAQAIDRIQNYHGRHMGMLQDLNVDINTLDHMQEIKEGTIRQLKAGVDKATIQQNIRLEIETMFGSGETADKMEQALYHQMSTPLNSNHLRRNTNEAFVRQELSDAKDRKNELSNSFVFSPNPSSGRRLENEASDILYDAFGRDTGDAKDKEMAKSVAIVKNRASGRFNARQQIDAMKFIKDHQNDKEEYSNMTNSLGYDVDELNASLADKVTAEYGDRNNPDAKPKVKAPNDRKGVHKQQYKEMVESAFEKSKDTLEYYDSDEGRVSDLEEISVNTLINNSNRSDDDIVRETINTRIAENRREADLLRDFASERRVDTPAPTPTLNGMTIEDIRAMADNERRIATKEATRGVAETLGAAAGVVPGAAAGIAFAETDKGPLAEGIAGAFGGAVLGDQIVDYTLGEKREREVWIRNPYTGEDEKVLLKIGGPLGDHISLNDPTLPENIRGHIDAQFRENAAKKRRVKEAQDRARIDRANRT